METLKSSETLVEGLVPSKENEGGNLFGGKFSGISECFDLGKVKCEESSVASVEDVRCVDRVGTSGHGDVSIKGISLFVELTGGVANKRDDVKKPVKSNVGEQELGVNVGDLVWAIIKKQKWWPGIVCDAADAAKEGAKEPTREDDILVKCFGNGNFIWCSPYEVRPFVGYFDHLPNQSNAKKFLDALENAVTELGRRVKAEFTCSCFSKMKKEKTGNFVDLMTRFEPTMFLDYIKDLGKDISMPHKIDHVVKQSCLSSFYRSLGHLQIPMHQLIPENGTPNVDDYEGANLNKTSGQSESQPVKKPRKKWTKKNKGVQANISSSEVLSQLQFAAKDCLFSCESKNFDSVGRFISGFRKRAFRDSSSETPGDVLNHPILQETLPKKVRKKKDKSVISPAFGNNLNHAAQFLNFQNVGSFNLEAGSMATQRPEWPANQNTIFSTMQGLYQAPVMFTNNIGPTPPYFTGTHGQPQVGIVPPPPQPPLRKLEPKRAKNIAENITPMPSSTLPNVNHMEGLYQAPVFFTNNFGPIPPYFTPNHGQPQAGPVPTGLTRVSKKRGRKKKNIDLQANPGSPLNFPANPGPPLNFPANPGPTLNFPANPGPPLNFPANLGPPLNFPANLGPPLNFPANLGPPLNFPANPGPSLNFPANLGPPLNFPANPVPTSNLQANPGPTMDLQTNPGPTLDLQINPGPTTIPNSNGSIIGQKKHKKVKRSNEVGVPCIDLSYNKVQQDNLEVKGTAFLLKFSSEYPLPSIQDLNSVFSKFGALIESETQVWNENLSGQVVFLDPSSAGGAFWGLQHDKPFGPVLVNYKIQHLTESESMVPFKTPIKSPSTPKPMDSNPKAIVGPTMIPDLNTNSAEVQIIKRSKIIEEIRLPSNDHHLSNNKVHQGTALRLTFSPNFPLPSVLDLNLIFCKYGEVNESETRVSGQDFTGQVVFVNPSAAADAIHRLDKEQPLGLALLSYQVHRINNVQSVVRVKDTVNGCCLKMKPPQDLGVIKKNLEMMNAMLEKSGDSLTPEMRGKLESEIKGLMNKLSALDGSSSSSSCL